MEKVFEIYIRTTPERLWDAIVDPEIRAKYNFGAAMHPGLKPGAHFEMTAPKSGGDPGRRRDPRGRPASPAGPHHGGVLQRRGEGRRSVQGDVGDRTGWGLVPPHVDPRPAARGRQRPALRRVADGPVGPQDVARVRRTARHAGFAHVRVSATSRAGPSTLPRGPDPAGTELQSVLVCAVVRLPREGW